MNKRICIFCLQKKNIKDFKPEHIIPQTLGNSLTLNNVCKKCNNDFSIYDQAISNYFKLERVLYIVRAKHSYKVKILNSSTNYPEIKIPAIFKYSRKSNSFNSIINGNYYYNKGKKILYIDKAGKKRIQEMVFHPKKESKRIPFSEQLKLQPQVKTELNELWEYTERVEKAILKTAYELIALILGETIINLFAMKNIKKYLLNKIAERLVRVISVEGSKESEVKIHHLYVQVINQDILVYIRYFGEHDFMIIVPIEKNKEIAYEKDFNLIRINPQKPKEILKEKAELFTREYLEEVKKKKISCN